MSERVPAGATIGLLHPGEMGSSVGAAAQVGGSRVAWASEGRSEATRSRAARAGLEDRGTVDRLVWGSGVIISVCPPSAALDVAATVASLGFAGTYVDANAISPATARAVAAVVRERGARFVDGSLLGPPAWRPGTTRLYLSGDGAGEIAALFEGSPLATIVLDAPAGAASALKMAYAGWTKGTSALIAGLVALALEEGVLEALWVEWESMGLRARAEGLGSAAAKAWRFTGEMEEIARSFREASLPGGFHEAAAEIYRRLERFKDDPGAPGGAELARWILAGGKPERMG